jgi:hypothetical protein
MFIVVTFAPLPFTGDAVDELEHRQKISLHAFLPDFFYVRLTPRGTPPRESAPPTASLWVCGLLCVSSLSGLGLRSEALLGARVYAGVMPPRRVTPRQPYAYADATCVAAAAASARLA